MGEAHGLGMDRSGRVLVLAMRLCVWRLGAKRGWSRGQALIGMEVGAGGMPYPMSVVKLVFELFRGSKENSLNAPIGSELCIGIGIAIVDANVIVDALCRCIQERSNTAPAMGMAEPAKQ